MAGASGQMAMPRSEGIAREVHILGEDQVQLRPAESEQPVSGQGGNWKVGLELQGAAWSGGGDRGVGWYLKS